MSRNLIHIIIFIIIIFSSYGLFYLCYNNNCTQYSSSNLKDTFVTHTSPTQLNPLSKPIFTVSFVSDTHLNEPIYLPLKKSLSKANPSLLIHTGDLTNFGTENEILSAKDFMDSLEVPYFAIPGDHDIASTSSDKYFNKYFSYPIFFTIQDINFLIIPNFYNFTPLDSGTLNTILLNLDSADVIVSSQPIYVDELNIFSNKYMGSHSAFDNLSSLQQNNLNLYNNQRLDILEILRNSKKNKIVISGDHHRSSNFTDPYNPKVKYHIVGSLAKYIYMGDTKLLQTSLQSNRFSILNIYKSDKSYNFEINEIEIK
jgi:predicted phosphodiesterase